MKGLAHHVGDRHGILARGVQSLLLGDEVVHGREQGLKRLAAAGKRSHLLKPCPLHRAPDHSQFTLRPHKLVDGGHVLPCGFHALLHHGLQLRLHHGRIVRLVDKGLHRGGEVADTVLHACPQSCLV